MAYTVKTDATHSKWWLTGTSTDGNNRLSDLMDDQADGPYYDVADDWTASAGDAAEYYHAPTKQPDNVYVSGVKLTEQADDTCADGGGGGLSDGEWCWETGNSRVYVQVAAGDPAGNADFYYNWNGGNSGTDFMSEIVADGIYRVHTSNDIGDATTSTVLNVKNGEYVRGDQGVSFFQTRTNGTFNLGEEEQSQSRFGAVIYGEPSSSSDWEIGSGGNVNIYGSTIFHQSGSGYRSYPITFEDAGDIVIKNSTFQAATAYNDWRSRVRFGSVDSLTMEDVFISGFNRLVFSKGGDLSDIWGHDIKYFQLEDSCTVENLKLTDIGAYWLWASWPAAQTMYILNPEFDLTALTAGSDVVIGNDGTKIVGRYTVDLHIADKDGSDIEGATVVWTDSQSNTDNDTTDSSGDVGFTLDVIKWETTSETETDYNNFTFTISKTGYETLTLDSVTINSKTIWHLELQAQRQPPAPWQEGML